MLRPLCSILKNRREIVPILAATIEEATIETTVRHSQLASPRMRGRVLFMLNTLLAEFMRGNGTPLWADSETEIELESVSFASVK